MPVIIVIALIAGAFVAVKAAAASKQPLPSSEPPPEPETTSETSNGSTALQTQVAAVVGGATAGAAVGSAINALLGGNQNASTTIAATVGGAGAGIAVALAVIGTIAWPVAAVVIGVAIAAYSVVALVTDIWRTSYGQLGAADEWRKQWLDVEDRVFRSLRAMPAYSNLDDKSIKRMSIPFADGYMKRLNRIEFRRYMNRFNVFRLFTDVRQHADYGSQRGYFVGRITGTDTLVDDGLPTKSDKDNFALEYCPPSELVTYTEKVRNPDLRVGL